MGKCEYRQITIRRNDGIEVTTEETSGCRESFNVESVYLDGFKVQLLGSGGFVLRAGFDGNAPFQADVTEDDLHGTAAVWIER